MDQEKIEIKVFCAAMDATTHLLSVFVGRGTNFWSYDGHR